MQEIPRLIIPIDTPQVSDADTLVEEFQDLPVILKVGSTSFLKAGPDWVRSQVKSGKKVFLDLKFHDIPVQIAGAALQAAELGVDMFTIHIAGGPKMVSHVMEAMGSLGSRRPKVLGVSVLTSFDAETWSQVTGAISSPGVSPSDSALGLVRAGAGWGLDGIVCSPHEVSQIKNEFPNLLTVVPGIRPAGSEKGDQARVMTPAEAIRAGADSIVVGRPITKSESPKAAAERILSEISNA